MLKFTILDEELQRRVQAQAREQLQKKLKVAAPSGVGVDIVVGAPTHTISASAGEGEGAPSSAAGAAGVVTASYVDTAAEWLASYRLEASPQEGGAAVAVARELSVASAPDGITTPPSAASPAPPSGKARLHVFARVQNDRDDDWTNVKLSLVANELTIATLANKVRGQIRTELN